RPGSRPHRRALGTPETQPPRRRGAGGSRRAPRLGQVTNPRIGLYLMFARSADVDGCHHDLRSVQKPVLLLRGVVSVALGVAGALMPLVPTMPFLLQAIAAVASVRLTGLERAARIGRLRCAPLKGHAGKETGVQDGVHRQAGM